MASDSDDSVENLKPYVDRPIVDFADFVRGQEDLAKRVKAFKKSRKKLVETQQAIEALSMEMDAAVKTASEAIKDIEEIKENMLKTMDKNLREKLERELLMLQQGQQRQDKQEIEKVEEKEQEEVDESKEQKQGDEEIEKMGNKELEGKEMEARKEKKEEKEKEENKAEEEKEEKKIKEKHKMEEEMNQATKSTSQKSEKPVKKSKSKK
ncbi:protein PXR1-like isoform X1 [Cephus cinctus]|uniref:Protein PXR1-like isoform X1 n=1 Tax=Cephus cinctus TaxID=211228 RepID=A0AAJ7RFT4_CEPCN|nr:protein PXR1-like isoform X1 [Cephus cinctus]